MSIKAKQFKVVLKQVVQSSQPLCIQGGKVLGSSVSFMGQGVHSGAQGQWMFNASQMKNISKIIRERFHVTNHVIVNFTNLTPRKVFLANE